MYKKADVVAVALRKFGSVAALAADRAAAHARLAKEREKRQSGEEARWWQFVDGLRAAGLYVWDILKVRNMPRRLPRRLRIHRASIRDFIKHNKGSSGRLVALVKQSRRN